MARPKQDEQVTARFVEWLEDSYGDRGRFATLESQSSIPAQRWKNVYYGRQGATPEMLAFVQATDSDAYTYVTTGIRVPQVGGRLGSFTPPSPEDRLTVGSRLKWVIRQWAGPIGSDLFTYLERRYKNGTSAADWANLYLQNAEPTAAMISAACRERPQFVEWVLFGLVPHPLQVDPTDKASIAKWVAEEEATLARLAGKNSP